PPKRRHSGRTGSGFIKYERVFFHRYWNGIQLADREDTAGAQKDQAGLSGSTIFEDVERPLKIMLYKLSAAGFAINAGDHTCIRRGIDYPIHIGDQLEIALQPHIT